MTPSQEEIEAAAEELIKAQHPTFLGRPKYMVRKAMGEAEAALTAAERVREDNKEADE